MSKSRPRSDGVVLVPLAEGFEEIEAVTIVDVLRRAGLSVQVAGLVPGTVRGAHGIELVPDTTLERVASASVSALVLPGGMPGTTHLMQDARVLALVRELDAAGRMVAAICAAPMVLSAAGILAGRSVTSYPSVRSRLVAAEVLDQPRVVRSGSVLTSQGVGTALEFALALAAELAGEAKARELREALLVPS
jgi:4-methyl-5(b-hydroxyethyl)-thiazole monophosphate biosynthesis